MSQQNTTKGVLCVLIVFENHAFTLFSISYIPYTTLNYLNLFSQSGHFVDHNTDLFCISDKGFNLIASKR